MRNRAELWVFAGLKEALARFPFKIRGIDSDNGSEFINNHLVRYCGKQKITFTRSRPYRKNDNCFVEQKNSSVVRRTVGYARHDTPEELELLNELYSRLRLYTNYFQPVMKLVEKTRTRESGDEEVRQGENTVRTRSHVTAHLEAGEARPSTGLQGTEPCHAGTRDRSAPGQAALCRGAQGGGQTMLNVGVHFYVRQHVPSLPTPILARCAARAGRVEHAIEGACGANATSCSRSRCIRWQHVHIERLRAGMRRRRRTRPHSRHPVPWGRLCPITRRSHVGDGPARGSRDDSKSHRSGLHRGRAGPAD